MNKNSLPDEEFEELEDNYIWSSHLDKFPEIPKGKGRKILAIVLICLGIYMLCNSIVSALAGMGIYISYEINEFYCIMYHNCSSIYYNSSRNTHDNGKKKAFDFDDEKYFEGREDK